MSYAVENLSCVFWSKWNSDPELKSPLMTCPHAFNKRNNSFTKQIFHFILSLEKWKISHLLESINNIYVMLQKLCSYFIIKMSEFLSFYYEFTWQIKDNYFLNIYAQVKRLLKMTHKVYFPDLYDRYLTENVTNIKTYNKDTVKVNLSLKFIKIK